MQRQERSDKRKHEHCSEDPTHDVSNVWARLAVCEGCCAVSAGASLPAMAHEPRLERSLVQASEALCH